MVDVGICGRDHKVCFQWAELGTSVWHLVSARGALYRTTLKCCLKPSKVDLAIRKQTGDEPGPFLPFLV